MKLRIDLKSTTPVYRQIVDGLRLLLVDGELTPGSVLPPVRRLALDLGVHFNTVAEAYRTLAADGWLEIGARSGARVIARKLENQPDPELFSQFQRRVRELAAEMQAKGFSRGRLARELRRFADALEGN